jgi:hypothetical protein
VTASRLKVTAGRLKVIAGRFLSCAGDCPYHFKILVITANLFIPEIFS